MTLYELSDSLKAAINAGNPQRVIIRFVKKPDGTYYNPQPIMSNEHLLMTDGLKLNCDFNSEKDLTIGLCPSAEITFSLVNDELQLSEFEFGTFIAYLGARVEPQIFPRTSYVVEFEEDGETHYYEFAPLGTFIAQRPDIVRKQILEITANDQMVLFDKEIPDNLFTFPCTLAQLTSAMCSHLGVHLKTNSWLNSDITVSARPDQFDGATLREVLSWVAEAACSNARFSRDGYLEFVWFNPVNKVYNEHDYSEFTPSWYEVQPINRLHIRNADSTAELKWPVNGTGTNAYLIQDNPFLRQPEPTNP